MKLHFSIGKFSLGFGQQKSAQSLAQAFARGDDLNDSAGAVLTSAYQQSVWVYACTKTIARTVAQIPLCFSRDQRGGEDRIENAPVVSLFNRPHPLLNRYQFLELLITWMKLRGEWFVLPDAEGRAVRKLTPLSPDNLRERVEGHSLVAWQYTGSATQTPEPSQYFLPEELITDREPHPFNFWRGMSPLSVAALAAQTDFASAHFMKGLMGNNAEQGLTVIVPTTLEDPQREQILAGLRNRRRKSGTANRDLILEGDAKIEYPTLSSADLQFLENRKFNRQEICAIMGVPQEIIGFTEDANRSVSDNARLNFLENQVAPMCERLETALQDLVSRIAPGVFVWFDIDAHPLMQAARRARWDVAIKQFGLGVPIDVISDDLDLGLPPLPHDGKSYLPFSVTEVGDANLADEPEATPANENPDATGDAAQTLAAKLTKLAQLSTPASTVTISVHAPPSVSVHICAPSSPQYVASIAGSVKLKGRKLSRYFMEQRTRVLAKLAEFDTAKTAPGAVTKGLADAIFDLIWENQILIERMQPLLRADLQFGAAMIANELNLGEINVPPTAALQALQARENRLREVNETTFANLRDSLSEGIAAGESYKDLAARVRSEFNATQSRSEAIALTETNTAVNVGRFEGMKAANVEYKAWLASNLAGSRVTHQQAGRDYADGIPVTEPFIVGGEKLMHPGDPNASAGNVINCKCTCVALEAPEKGARRVEVKLLSFETWAAKQPFALGTILPADPQREAGTT